MRRIWFAILLTGLMAAPATAQDRSYAQTGQTCDGFPRAQIAMAPGFCAGIVVAPPANFRSRPLVFPRLLLADGDDQWLVSDLGHWGSHDGKVMRVKAVRGKPPELTPLLTRLYNPHGLGRGPDAKIYVADVEGIFRFDAKAANPQASMEPVIEGLAAGRPSRHPLISFLFDANNDLLVELGSTSDQCAINNKPNGTGACAETQGDGQRAAIRRYAYQGGGKWSSRFTLMARGLRNSPALVRHASGTLVQAENSMDFSTPDSPFEEVNVVRPGAHYGWPYCFDMDKQTPAWANSGAMDCRSKAHTKPLLLLPPHAAPLSLVYYDGGMFPQLRGQLLMAWHGYRQAGARIAAFPVDAQGVPVIAPHSRYAVYGESGAVDTKPYPGPAADAFILTQNWSAKPGERPRGTPVGLGIGRDGAIWITEDFNATILRIARDQP